MFFDILLVVFGFCFLLGGLAGCVVPVIPGPPLGYIALLLLQATRFADYSIAFLLLTAAVMVVVTVFDYLLPVWGTRKWGGSRAGALGALAGILIGLFFLPIGIIVGPFAGAVAGELITGRDRDAALRSGFGSFVGFIVGVGAKLAVGIAFSFYFIKELIF